MLVLASVRKATFTVALAWPLLSLAVEVIDVPKLAREARPAVVVLEVEDADGDRIGRGTGFFISADGTLVTNYHVIEGGVRFIAKTDTGAFYLVKKVLQTDKGHDLAILKADAKGVPFLRLGKATDIEAGSRIAVIGSPLGLEGSVSDGIVSALRGEDEDRFLQITAPISPGSSGSPVLNAAGEVVGVVTAYLSKGQNVNLAIPAEDVEKLASRPVASFDAATAQPWLADPVANSVTSDPDYARVSELLRSDDAVSALKLLNELVKRFPDSPAVRFQLGFAYAKLGFNEDAIRSYRSVVKAIPDDWVAWGNMVTLYLATGQMDQAKTASETAIKIDPTAGFAWRVRGIYLWHTRQPRSAVEALERSVKLQPDESASWNILATYYRLAGQTAKGEAAERRAKQVNAAEEKQAKAAFTTAPKLPGGKSDTNAWGDPIARGGIPVEVDEFISVFLDATVTKDLATLFLCYDSKVDFYDKGVVGTDVIEADLRKLFSRWPKYSISNRSPVTVTGKGKNGSTTVSFNYDFYAEEPEEGRWSSGSTRNTATLAQAKGGLFITSIRQTIFNRKSNSNSR